MFKYSQIESAIAAVHGVSSDAMDTFRGRVKHFQRIGIVPSSPGKGQRIIYTVDDALRWAICFEFAEVGIPPAEIKSLISTCGRSLFKSFGGPIQGEDEIFYLRGEFLQWHLNKETGDLLGRTTFGVIPISRLGEMINSDLTRLILINLTRLKREFGRALDIEWV
ncbi:MAG TPA: hypothetical protein VIE66_16285 [Methylocella sp.]